MITGEMVAEKAKSLLNMGNIPYVNGGESTSGMDCQGLVEWALRECGFACSYKGTNDMWRNMLSEKGTIEMCVKRWGKVPLGALIFIHSNNGGEPASYADDEGNAEHVYIKIADGTLIHASAGNGKVLTRTFADKTIPNGGANAYGLVSGITYTGSRTPDDSAGASSANDESDTDTAQETPSKLQTAAYKPRYSHLMWKRGDVGGGAREVQEGLRRAGYDEIAVDGEFGAATEYAVMDLQAAHGLTVDGIVGKQTWAALIEAANS